MESLPDEIWNKIHLFNSHPCADIMKPLIESAHCLITDCPVEKSEFDYRSSFPFKLAWGGFLIYIFNKHKHEVHQLYKSAPAYNVKISRLNLLLELGQY